MASLPGMTVRHGMTTLFGKKRRDALATTYVNPVTSGQMARRLGPAMRLTVCPVKIQAKGLPTRMPFG